MTIRLPPMRPLQQCVPASLRQVIQLALKGTLHE
jgi:hypothetical protein